MSEPPPPAFERFRDSVREIARAPWNKPNLSEATVRQVIVLRLLMDAGFNIWNPLEVSAEETNAAKNRPDLIVSCGEDKENNAFVLELKRRDAPLDDGSLGQALAYAGQIGIRWAILTNGQAWVVADEKKSGPYPERVVLRIELLQTNVDAFASDLHRLLERRVWQSATFENALRHVQTDLEKRLRREQILIDKTPILEKFMLENTIQNRSKAADLMVQLSQLSDFERDVLLGHDDTSSKTTNQTDSHFTDGASVLGVLNQKSALFTNDLLSEGFHAEWNGAVVVPRNFRNLYLSLAEVAIAHGLTPQYATDEQLQKWPEVVFARLSTGRKLDKNLDSKTSRKRIKALLEALQIPPGTLRITYKGTTYTLP